MTNCNIAFSNILKCRILYLDDYFYDEETHYIYGTFDKLDLTKQKKGEKLYTSTDGTQIRILKATETFVNPKLLSSLITLKQKLPPYSVSPSISVYNHSDITAVENLILNNSMKDKYINLILDWCRKNGMPFCGDIRNEYSKYFITPTNKQDYVCYGFDNDFTHLQDLGTKPYKFSLGCFLIGLHIIYTTFIFSISLNKDKFLDNTKSDYIYTYLNNITIHKNEFSNISKEFINTSIKSMRIYISTEYDNNELIHFLYAETLFSAAMYQLLWFIAYTNQKVAICQYCKQIYVQIRKSMKFCSNTCRQANHREKQKG